jgi:hypothetical protein
MNFKIIAITCSIVLSTNYYSQEFESFEVKGPVKLLGSWSDKANKVSEFGSSSGEKFKIYKGQQGITLQVITKTNGEILSQVDGSYGTTGRAIKIYEFDFDNDRDFEYIVVSAYSPIEIEVQVFKISKGLIKLIGNFKAQHDIVVSKNFILFPIGSQGDKWEYYFRNDAFYELNYHNPNKKR